MDLAASYNQLTDPEERHLAILRTSELQERRPMIGIPIFYAVTITPGTCSVEW